jgi:hypothetical protein
VYAYAWATPREGLLYRGLSTSPGGTRLSWGPPVDLWLTAGGVVLLAAAPFVTAGVVALDVRLARALLGPSRATELEVRVERLTRTRAGAVDGRPRLDHGQQRRRPRRDRTRRLGGGAPARAANGPGRCRPGPGPEVLGYAVPGTSPSSPTSMPPPCSRCGQPLAIAVAASRSSAWIRL